MQKQLVLAAWAAAAMHAQTVINGDRKILGNWDASVATATIPFSVGTVGNLPATCSAGQMYFATDGAPGRNLYGCPDGAWRVAGYRQGTAAAMPPACAVGDLYFATDAAAGANLYACGLPNTWTAITGTGGASAVASVFGRTGAVTAQNGDYTKAQVGLGNVDNTSDAAKPVSTATAAALAGKMAGVAGSGVVKVTAGSPGLVSGAATDCVRVDGTSTACGTAEAGSAPYSCAVSNASSATCAHNLGTTTPQVWCYDASGNLLGSTAASADVTSVTATSANAVTITFSGATTGTCRIATGGQGPAGPQGPQGPAVTTSIPVVGYNFVGSGTANVLIDGDLTQSAVRINNGDAKTLTEVSCISDTGSQAITAKIGSTTLFTITCVPAASYSRATTNGSTGYLAAGSMGSTAVPAGAVINTTGTANGSTRDAKLFAYGTVN